MIPSVRPQSAPSVLSTRPDLNIKLPYASTLFPVARAQKIRAFLNFNATTPVIACVKQVPAGIVVTQGSTYTSPEGHEGALGGVLSGVWISFAIPSTAEPGTRYTAVFALKDRVDDCEVRAYTYTFEVVLSEDERVPPAGGPALADTFTRT
jgi:hypothetical protein